MYIIRIPLLLSVLLFINLVPHRVSAIEMDNRFKQQIDIILTNEPDLKGAIIGISIRSGSNGQMIYQHMGDIRLHPASNQKLLTAVAAFQVLGINQTVRTEVLTDGKMRRKTIKGNLYLKGKGDPTLLLSDLKKLANNIRKKGIRQINGDIFSDDSWFDNIRYSADLPWNDETAYYGAQISALTVSLNQDFEQGSIIIEVYPKEKIGKKPSVKVIPKTNYVTIINKAVTVSADEKKTIHMVREHAKNTIIISGSIPVKAKKAKEIIAVWDPSRFTLELFAQALKKQGIKVNGLLKTGRTPEHSKVLTYHDSQPLSERMKPFIKLSNNSHGEMLIKEMGKLKKDEGSWDKGMAVLIKELVKLQVNPETMVLRDGSGISHINLVPPNQITKLLFVVQNEKWFPQFKNSLPISGMENKMIGGTLRNRLYNVRGKVWAKTGTISTVSSLSGYVDTKSGRQLIFSIIINNLLDEAKGKSIEDKIVTLLANQ